MNGFPSWPSANVTPSTAGYAARHLLWMVGARFDAAEYHYGKLFLIDSETAATTTQKVAERYGQRRDQDAIQADLMAYFTQLKLETN